MHGCTKYTQTHDITIFSPVELCYLEAGQAVLDLEDQGISMVHSAARSQDRGYSGRRDGMGR